jgi:hypothetical protein
MTNPQEIRIFRKSSATPRPKASKSDLTELARKLEVGAIRVDRPSLVEFFTPEQAGRLSEFYRLPALSPACIANRPHRIIDHADAGWTIPADSLGRKGVVTASTAQSILLWIKQNLAAFVNAEDVSVVVE